MSLEDRRSCIELVKQAKAGGAGRAASCQVLDVSLRTVRWEKDPNHGDQRRGPDTVCEHIVATVAHFKPIIPLLLPPPTPNLSTVN